MSETTTDYTPDEQLALNPAGAPDTAPEAAPPAETPPEEPQQRPQQTVPLASLMEERERAKVAREENRRLQQMIEDGNKRLAELARAVAPKPPAEQLPDLNTDPVGYFKAENDALKRQLAEVAQWKQQLEQQGQQVTAEQQFYQTYQAQVAQYQQQAPDTMDALQHLSRVLRSDFQALGMSPQEATEAINQQERMIVAKAFRDGVNPAERLYAYAKTRGYQGAAKPDGAARMEAMQRGQAAAKSTSGPAARDGYAGLTLEDVTKMPYQEFSKIPETVLNRLLGG